ncbi:hypothetical protein DEM27_10670 [Metarhizobium album]|uniref:Tyr recombinase domain-containing protein n=1 Tax=Metarhizobium album TaxID=2182425 RepID=A0A2U2DRL4_9HYPH|nr:tyrosine-type recombinase/integrase [Rhizobium album]PWE55912.1 hypothetical protein DEM27_10670 [Rhizobium album]
MNMNFMPAFEAATTQAEYEIKSFAEAAASYIEHGGEAKYLDEVLPHIGDKMLSRIFSFDVQQLANQLKPEASNATKNRCVVTPIRAVCNHGHERGWGPVGRIKAFKMERPKRKDPASPAWIMTFLRQCDKDGLPHLAALVLFMSKTGARVSEAIALCWSEVDLARRTALLLKTKTERNSIRHMSEQLVSRLSEMRVGAGEDDRVFGYRNRHSVNDRIRAVCERAEITYKPSHTCGRHAYATNTLAMGMDIKSTMDAGGWRSISIFLGTYVNPHDAGRAVAARHSMFDFQNAL